MAKTYSLKKRIPREMALAMAEELVTALPDTVIVGSLRWGVRRPDRQEPSSFTFTKLFGRHFHVGADNARSSSVPLNVAASWTAACAPMPRM
jgi:hypothetical protein